MNSINNNLDMPEDLIINVSVLDDEEKTLNLVQQIVNQREGYYYIPKSFDEISVDIFNLMRDIDNVFQRNLISRDIVLELFADLFEIEYTQNGFMKYLNDINMKKLRDLFKLLEDKYRSLIHKLAYGEISQAEFLEKIRKLGEITRNTLSEIHIPYEKLKKSGR